MIRNVCIHVENEQPLLADLYAVPTAADAGLLCTNIRTMDGKRPVFIDRTDATFFFPYHVVRFIEIAQEALAAHDAAGGTVPGTDTGNAARSRAEASEPHELRLPVPARAGADDGADGELELEIDEDFLQRVRDI